MKSFVKFTTLAMAIAVAACTGVEEWDNTPYQPDPILPEFQKPKSVEFTANVATKTVLNESDNSVTWATGDQVRFVWEGGSTTASAESAGTVTTFYVDIPAVVEELYAVYPANLNVSVSAGKLLVKFAENFDGLMFADSDFSAAKAVVKDGEWESILNFKKVSSIVRIGVVNEGVTSLKVSAPGQEGIAGRLSLNISEDGEVVCDAPTETSHLINMDVSSPGIYYLPMLPDVALSNGLNVTFYEGESASETLVEDSDMVARGDIIRFAQPEIFTGKYYVTPKGTGSMSGLSVLNSMDVETFKAFVTDPANVEQFNGKTFNFSANEFSFGDDYLILDYPDYEKVSITFEGTESGDNMTAFAGRMNTTDDNKAGVLWPQHNVSLTVKNVKFAKTDGKSNSAAIRVNTSSASLDLENCIFSGNKTVGQGAAIAAFKGKINLKDCDFIDNTALCGAGIFVDGPVVIDVNGGTFEGNSATGSDDTQAAGAVFYASGDATLSFTDVNFKSNWCNTGSNVNTGGILRLQTTTGLACFDGCVFDGNYCCRDIQDNKGVSAIITARVAAKYYFNACEFKNNASGTYAGIGGKYGMLMAAYSGATLAFNNCYIHDTYGGRNTDPIDWIYVGNDGAELLLANSTIIGDPMRKTSATANPTRKNTNGVLYLANAADYHFFNNILCSQTASGKSVLSNVATQINSMYNKTSPANSNTTWVTDTGSGHDYHAAETCFGGLDGFIWNGNLSGTNSTSLAKTSTISDAIKNADSAFYSWLEEIGAIGKDIEGNDRGETSWPGCYQN